MNQQLPVASPLQRVPLRVEDVELLDRQGALDGYGKVELIDGELLYVNAQYRRHMVVKSELAYRIRRALERADIPLFVGIEGSVALSNHDLPQPDIILTSAPDGDGAVPGASVALLVEVADATLSFDLGRKARSYAKAGIPEYWVVDVKNGVFHQMWQPVEQDYCQQQEVDFGESLSAATIIGLTIETSSI